MKRIKGLGFHWFLRHEYRWSTWTGAAVLWKDTAGVTTYEWCLYVCCGFTLKLRLCFLGAVEMNVLIALINLWRSVAHMSHVGSTSCQAAALLLRLYSLPAGHLRNILFQINQ